MQLLDDIKFALRLLAKTPGFTVATLVVITAGLSLYIASLTFARLLSGTPMPFPEGDRFVVIKSIDSRTGIDNPFQHDLYSFNQIKNNSTSYSALGAFQNDLFSISDGEAARQYPGVIISQELLAATQVNPILGRGLAPDDSVAGAEKVALIGYELWQDFYNGNTQVVGRTVLVNGELTTIVGVMPEGFGFPRYENLWLPLSNTMAVDPGPGFGFTLVGVLAPGIDHQVAEVEANIIRTQLAEEFPEFYANRSELIFPYAYIADQVRPVNGTETFVNATLIVLALSIVNLSSLLLIKSGARDQELAVRVSVGSSAWQLIKQVMLESLLICLLGLALSLVIGSILLAGMESILDSRPGNPLFFWYHDITPDIQVVGRALFWTIVVWLLSSLITSLRVYRSQPAEILSANSDNSSKKSSSTGTGFVVASEVFLSCFLLLGGMLLTVAAWQFATADFGVDPERFAVGKYSLDATDYTDPQRRLAYVDALNDEILEAPGIAGASTTTAPPGVYGQFGTYNFLDSDLTADDQLPSAAVVWVDDNYFDVIDIDVVQGRGFDSSDTSSSQDVVIINETFARQLWPNESPIGKSVLSRLNGQDRSLTIVGTISRLVQGISPMPANEILYRPITQDTPSDFFLIASDQGQLSNDDLQQAIIQAGNRVDSSVPINDIRTLVAEIDANSPSWSLLIGYSLSISIATVILAIIGVYAVIARSISLQTRDIGIRRALGSSNSRIVIRFLKKASYFLVPAIVVGIGAFVLITVVVGASGITSVAISYLPELSALVGALMVFLVAMATYLPTRKAVRLEPGDALRYE